MPKFTGVPRAEIIERPATPQDTYLAKDVVYEVADELGSWGTYPTYAAAAERVKARRSIERAMRTRRANKAAREARA